VKYFFKSQHELYLELIKRASDDIAQYIVEHCSLFSSSPVFTHSHSKVKHMQNAV